MTAETAVLTDGLQDAMDAITGSEIPITIANAFRLVGLGLVQRPLGLGQSGLGLGHRFELVGRNRGRHAVHRVLGPALDSDQV